MVFWGGLCDPHWFNLETSKQARQPKQGAERKQGQWYRATARQMRRLQAVIPGPINAIYGETVAGTAVIRAFGVQSVFVDGECPGS